MHLLCKCRLSPGFLSINAGLSYMITFDLSRCSLPDEVVSVLCSSKVAVVGFNVKESSNYLLFTGFIPSPIRSPVEMATVMAQQDDWSSGTMEVMEDKWNYEVLRKDSGVMYVPATRWIKRVIGRTERLMFECCDADLPLYFYAKDSIKATLRRLAKTGAKMPNRPFGFHFMQELACWNLRVFLLMLFPEITYHARRNPGENIYYNVQQFKADCAKFFEVPAEYFGSLSDPVLERSAEYLRWLQKSAKRGRAQEKAPKPARGKAAGQRSDDPNWRQKRGGRYDVLREDSPDAPRDESPGSLPDSLLDFMSDEKVVIPGARIHRRVKEIWSEKAKARASDRPEDKNKKKNKKQPPTRPPTPFPTAEEAELEARRSEARHEKGKKSEPN